MPSVEATTPFILKSHLHNTIISKSSFPNDSLRLIPLTFFNHKDYKIEVMFEDNSYTRVFRKAVLWNFGDGTLVEGIRASHYYKTPGKYRINCIFYDIDRKSIEGEYYLDIVVKEIIPTSIDFIKESGWKKEYNISKNNKLGSLSVTLNKNIEIEPKIEAIRKEPGINERSYEQISNTLYYHLEKYYTFLEENIVNTIDNSLRRNILTPVTQYTPKYYSLYGKFSSENNIPVLHTYIVVDDPSVNVNDFQIKIFNPANNPNELLYAKFSSKSLTNIVPTKVYSVSSVPSDYEFIGKVASVNIWYKNDVKTSNELIFEFKKDNFTVNGTAVPTYINMPNIGVTVNTVANTNSMHIIDAITVNGLLSSSYINNIINLDLHFVHNLYFNYPIEFYYSHFIENDRINNDIDKPTYNLLKDENVSLFDIYAPLQNPNCKVELISDKQYYKKYIITPLSQIGLTLFYGNNVQRDEFFHTSKIKDLDEIILPKENLPILNINELLDVYMAHPMYDNASNLRQFLFDIFSNKNMLSYAVTKGQNFINDNINYKTCYIDNLLSLLEMMGETIKKYDITSFDKNNDLKELTRILTMNYSDLFGNVLSKNFDTKITHASIGKNVSDKLEISDVIYCDEDYNIIGIRRGSKIYKLSSTTPYIIIKDDFTFKTKITSFAGISVLQKETFEDQNKEWIENNQDFINKTKYSYKISDFDSSWHWPLILPEEIRYKNDKGLLIDAYYSFYLLNPSNSVERKYNFISDETIPLSSNGETQITLEEWEKDFGFTYDCLMKVLTENLMTR